MIIEIIMAMVILIILIHKFAPEEIKFSSRVNKSMVGKKVALRQGVLYRETTIMDIAEDGKHFKVSPRIDYSDWHPVSDYSVVKVLDAPNAGR